VQLTGSEVKTTELEKSYKKKLGSNFKYTVAWEVVAEE